MERDAPKRELRCAPDQTARVNEADMARYIVQHAKCVPRIPMRGDADV